MFCSVANAEESQLSKDALEYSEWISKALSSSGYRADFTIESLKEVDRFIDDNSINGQPKPDGLLGKQLGSKLFALGSYVGEVIRREVGGNWVGNDSDPQGEINIEVHLSNSGKIWPVQKIMKRLKNGSEDGIYVYGVAMVQRANHNK